MAVVISLNDKKLKRYLEKSAGGFHYIYLGERKDNLVKLLESKSFKEINLYELDDTAKDEFLRSYVDLIGRLGQKYQSVFWWATYTAAKNAYGTIASCDNLFVYYHVIKKISEAGIKNLLVINPPPAIGDLIARYCSRHHIKFKLLAKRLRLLRTRIRDFLGYGMFLVAAIQVWRKIYISRKYLKRRLDTKVDKAQSYYVLRPWFYERSITKDGEYHDITFTVLPEYLVNKGKPFLVAAGILGDYKRIVQKITTVKDYLIFPEELFLKYADPVRAVIDLFTHKIRIDGAVDLKGLDVSGVIQAAIAKEFQGGLADYMHRYYARRLLEKVSVDTYITTFENNAWEKVNILTLRQYAPQIKIIAHQCTPLFAAKVAIMAIGAGEKDIIPLPDRINTIGRVTKSILESYGKYKRSQLKESCALRIESFKTEVLPRGLSHRILVIAGGIVNRAIRMINLVYRALKDDNRYQVVIRTHPGLPLAKFQDSLDFEIASWKNHILSDTMSVVEDLHKADMIIHEGSTISLEALQMGIPVIYVSCHEINSFDPLIGCPGFKWAVGKEEELINAVEDIYKLTDDEFRRQQQQARQYLTDYIFEVTEERLNDYIL